MMIMRILSLLLLLILISCDFSSNLHNNIYLAQNYLSQYEYKKAVDLYKDILNKSPNEDLRVKINFQIAEINSIYLRNYSEAAIYYKNVFDISKKPLWQVKSLEKLADIHFNFLKNYKSATGYYKILMAFKPKLVSYDFYEFQMAKAFTLSRNFVQSLRIFSDISKNEDHEYYVNSYYELGIGNFYLKNWDQAIINFTEYIKREVNRNKIVNAKYMIANAYETNEQLKRAYNVYHSILNEYPNTEVIKQRLNAIYQRQIARKR
jgi:tetratricopeptide (TPR) repeat protein